MNLPAPTALFTPSWHAELELGYARFGDSTRPVQRRHKGPLRVQKHLYAEGPEVCQHIIVHPPGGIAGGDRLDISASVGTRCLGANHQPRRGQVVSRGRARLSAAGLASGEPVRHWNGCRKRRLSSATLRRNSAPRIDLEGDARLFYWDVVALGRPASGERFDLGHFQAQLDIRRDGQLLWHERQRIVGGDGLLDSPIGLDGQPVFATLLVTGEIDSELLEKCRSLPNDVRGDLTQLPGLLVARCLASEALLARGWLIDLWRLLRPALLGPRSRPTTNMEHLNTDPL